MTTVIDMQATAVQAEKPRASRAMQPQPLEIVNIAGARLNIRTVEVLVSRSKSWILREIKAGRFPPAVRDTPTSSDYLADDIKDYLSLTGQGIEWTPRSCRPGAQ